MRLPQVRPDRRKRIAEIPQEVGQDLAYGLRFAREFREIVAVVHRALAKPPARMPHLKTVAPDDRHGGGPVRTVKSRPAQRHGTE